MMRKWMIDLREKKLMSRSHAAQKAHVSGRLLLGLEEDDWITHPDCAAWIAKAYGMNVEQYNQLVHKKHCTDVLPKPKPLPGEKEWLEFQRKAGII